MIDAFAPFKRGVVCECLDAACRYKGCKILLERARCLKIVEDYACDSDGSVSTVTGLIKGDLMASGAISVGEQR